jgi:SAM-dependent methyltransferase
MTTKIIPKDKIDVRAVVRKRYGRIAESAMQGTQTGCCPPSPDSQSSCCGSQGDDAAQLNLVSKLYEDPNVVDLPSEVTDISLGCGDPVTLASLQPGQTVLDLGSGGGIDCFLAARRVGPTGRVIGVDMTATMIEKARANQEKVGVENVEFRLSEIEHLPVADQTVDVIISNCVINLSPDKPQVFREAFRVMKPGGKLAVSDIVTDGPLPEVIKSNLDAWAGCVAGALDIQDYIRAIEDAGFVDVEVTPTDWEQDMIDSAVQQLEPELTAQVEGAKEQGKAVLMVNEGEDSKVIEVDPEDGFENFDPKKTIFSAKVTAYKPE